MIDKKTIQYLRTRLSDIENRRTLIISTLISLTEKSNSIRKNPQFNKYGTEDRVSNKIESLEQDLVVSTYSIKDTRDKQRYIDSLRVELQGVLRQRAWEEELRNIGKEKKQLFSQLKEIRREVTELNAAICVAWSIIYSRSHGLEITPDEVSSELVTMDESVYRELRKNHSLQVILTSFFFLVINS